jgi:hypothetical protein
MVYFNDITADEGKSLLESNCHQSIRLQPDPGKTGMQPRNRAMPRDRPIMPFRRTLLGRRSWNKGRKRRDVTKSSFQPETTLI